MTKEDIISHVNQDPIPRNQRGQQYFDAASPSAGEGGRGQQGEEKLNENCQGDKNPAVLMELLHGFINAAATQNVHMQ